MTQLITKIIRNVQNDAGQAMAEYALILGLIAAVCVALLIVLGGDVTGIFTDFVTKASLGGGS